ncbi:MAG: AGE family epimerase/isomerase [Elusimicrobiota bacterium]
MNPSAAEQISRSKDWLSKRVFPLWLERGIDHRGGAFVEALSLKGEAIDLPRRALVQARQIYSFRTAARLGFIPENAAREIVGRAAGHLVDRYSVPSGAFIHSVDVAGKPHSERLDLYTQAFGLFGLANAYALLHDEGLKKRASALAAYLSRERRAPDGGYTELENGAMVYRSNPHMHLFEAALAWKAVDPDPRWKTLADEVLELCLARFFDANSGSLCENFQEGWALSRTDGRFFFEPGHHYEWSWLMLLHEEATGRDLSAARAALFRTAEEFGRGPQGDAMDEIWSDGAPKKKSSRFWPQCERIKAAVRMGARAPKSEQARFARAADEAAAALFRFFEVPTPGLWRDTRLESGAFREEPAKGSSLYHIINALDEYAAFRPVLTD